MNALLSAPLSVSPEDLAAVQRVLAALGGNALPALVQHAQPVPLDPRGPPEHSFEAFCTDRLLDEVKRPFGRVMSRGTFTNTRRHLRAMGYLDDEGRAIKAPDWPAFRKYLREHPKGPQSCDNQRRALVWLSAYWRVPVPEETWAKMRLDDKQSVAVARREGRMKERIRFFRPAQLQRLVATRNESFESELNEETHRTIAYTQTFVGSRGGEPWYWRLKDFKPEMNLLNVWCQKQQKHRAVQPPEPYALLSDVDPSIARYLAVIRPKLDPDGKHSSPDDPLFLTCDEWTGKVAVHENKDTGQKHGWPTEAAFRQFVTRGTQRALGSDEVAGPHGWRRACATMRVRHGATVEQVAVYLGDTPDVVRKSYVDWEWLQSPGVGILPAPRVGLAKIPRVRPDQFISYGRVPRGASAVEQEGMPEHEADEEPA